MRIVSLVPSLTETLVVTGANVVGRTRFCIHPEAAVADIPAVGGTKDVDWQKVADLKPDLVVFDKEENTLAMSDACPYPQIALHVTSVQTVADELQKLQAKVSLPGLQLIIDRWQKVVRQPCQINMLEIPGVQQWIKKPDHPLNKIVYLIWQQPYMCVGRDTFIGSVFEYLGLGDCLQKYESRYPEISINSDDALQTLYLFSSEPYPFHKKVQEISELGIFSAIVDGEKYSWFGVRSLEFLEDLQK